MADDYGESSHGIQALIDTLRQDGVAAGEEESKRIVNEAETRAEWIIQQAQQEAEQIRRQAESEADYLRQAGRESLELALRDTQLKLKDQLLAQFSHNLQRLVGLQLEQADVLGQLLTAIAARSELPEGRAMVELPAQAALLSEINEHPEMLKGDTLVAYVSDLTAGLLREGVELRAGDQREGLKIHLDEGDVRVEFTEQVLTDLLLDYLQPRFRALLEGVTI